jgi:hypothetical protein
MTNLNEYELNTEVLTETAEFEGEGEMVHELMEVSNEMEFENFLGGIWDAAKRLYNSPQGQAIKKDFIAGAKSFGRKMFPSIGKNLGGYIGSKVGKKWTKTGEKIGGALGGAASKWLLGESAEQEAVNYVRVIRKAANYLNKALASGASPGISAPSSRALVTQAINKAARPVILRQRQQEATSSINPSQKQGQWLRKGNSLVLTGVS